MLLTFLQENMLPILKNEDAESVKTMLVYFLGVLTILLVTIVRYLVKQNIERFKEKDNLIANKILIIAEKERLISEIQLKLDTEILYSKEMATSTTRVLMDNTAALKTAIKSLEALGVDVSTVKAVLVENNNIVKDMKDHQMNLLKRH